MIQIAQRYNSANELTAVTGPAPDLWKTSYTYDSVGNLLTRKDAKNHITTYEYDTANRLSSVLSHVGQRWTYAYDAASNRIKMVNPAGNATSDPDDGTTTFSYDQLNRLAAIGYSDATPDVTYGYDANGNRTSMNDGGSETYTYDALNRLSGLARGSDSFSYVYDLAGNATKRTYPGSVVTDYTYDDDGRMATVIGGGGTTSYAYDQAGNLVTTTLPSGNGYIESRVYDRAGRLTEVKNAKGSTVLSRSTYTLDATGNPTTTVTQSGTMTFAYDTLDRVTEVCFAASCPGPNDPFIRYSYDAVGNRLTESRSTGTTNYTYNDADQLTIKSGSSGTTNYTYDPNGNQITAGPATFTYDLANRVKSAAVGGITTQYSYDGDGKRLQASKGSQASQKTNYIWDVNSGVPALGLERDGNNALLRRYVYGIGRVSMVSGNKTYYYHYDGLGSVLNLTSSTGATQWSYTYEPFGTTRTEVKGNNNAPLNLMRFAGELVDNDTALYHLRARQYDPALGRFLASDPAAPSTNELAVSSYVYADDRPTVMVDPTGYRPDAILADDECGRIADQMLDRMSELAGRAIDILENPLNLPQKWEGEGPRPKGADVEGHQVQFKQKQANLTKLLNQLDEGCGGDTGLFSDVYVAGLQWATSPVPSPLPKPVASWTVPERDGSLDFLQDFFTAVAVAGGAALLIPACSVGSPACAAGAAAVL